MKNEITKIWRTSVGSGRNSTRHQSMHEYAYCPLDDTIVIFAAVIRVIVVGHSMDLWTIWCLFVGYYHSLAVLMLFVVAFITKSINSDSIRYWRNLNKDLFHPFQFSDNTIWWRWTTVVRSSSIHHRSYWEEKESFTDEKKRRKCQQCFLQKISITSVVSIVGFVLKYC